MTPLKWIRSRINEWLTGHERAAWDEGFDYAWNLAERYAGMIAYPDLPGEGYDANPYRDRIATAQATLENTE